MKHIPSNILGLIQEINQLWDPVYPYLANHIYAVYTKKDGVILEIGPFCGVILALMAQGVGSKFIIGAFPTGIELFFHNYLKKKGLIGEISVAETDESLAGIRENSIDLVIFRGALFFPSLFRVDYHAISRVMKTGGLAMIGGGFGKFTPPEVIRTIAERSKDLNFRIGKIEVTAAEVKGDIEASGAVANYRIVHEGGLWVLLNKS